MARIRVLVVDDSSVARKILGDTIAGDAAFELVGSAADGRLALEQIERLHPDIVTLDIEMPNMDGLTALPLLRKLVPQARIVMASTLTSAGAQQTVKALSLGAADFIAKPQASAMGGVDSYRRDLIEKIIALGPRLARTPSTPAPSAPLRPRSMQMGNPSIMVVAASTGGPGALPVFLGPIARRIDAPILIVQHMPATFTPVFAEKIESAIGKRCREAVDGDVLAPGCVYLAPGDYHMRIARSPAGRIVTLDKTPPVNFCRPAADPLFESAAAAFGNRVLAVVLTGMGHDGRDGAGHIVKAGGRVLVQDEASSVGGGMPGAVAQAGLAEAIKPLSDLGATALRMMNGEAA